MQWIDFPPVAEFMDRSGVVRRIYGPTLMGRFEFVDRLNELQEILGSLDGELGWMEVYQQEGRLKNVIDRALALWGVKAKWLAPSQIEQLLFCRGDQPGWLTELMNPAGSAPLTGQQDTEAKTMAQAIAQVASICGSLTEAIELAGTVPGALLVDVITASADKKDSASGSRTPEATKKEDWIKANYDRLMANG
jgi:hypothetical protein